MNLGMRIGLGSYRSFDQAPSGPAAAALAEVLRGFHAAGGRFIDSSPMYGRAEACLGALSSQAGLNADFCLATKVWCDGREAGERQMEESLRRLGRRRLELMQVHNLRDLEAHWPTLEAWKAAGRIEALGVTHYQVGAFEALERVLRSRRVDWLQIPYSLAEPSAEQRLLGVAADLGVSVIANEPFDQGGLFQRVAGRPLPDWARAELGVRSWAAYFLKYILGEPRVDVTIPATSQPAHLREFLAAADGPLPTPAQRARMRQDLDSPGRRAHGGGL